VIPREYISQTKEPALTGAAIPTRLQQNLGQTGCSTVPEVSSPAIEHGDVFLLLVSISVDNRTPLHYNGPNSSRIVKPYRLKISLGGFSFFPAHGPDHGLQPEDQATSRSSPVRSRTAVPGTSGAAAGLPRRWSFMGTTRSSRWCQACRPAGSMQRRRDILSAGWHGSRGGGGRAAQVRRLPGNVGFGAPGPVQDQTSARSSRYRRDGPDGHG